jgi:hypothetical protein
MPTLIVELHCMCLFVPDPETGSMHVLMPAPPEHAADDGSGGSDENDGRDDAAHRSRGKEAPGRTTQDRSDNSTDDSGGDSDDDSNGDSNGDSDHDSVDHGPEPHVVRMLHRSFTGQPKGRPMEGWALVVDNGRGSARLDVAVPGTTVADGEVPDLTTICGHPVNAALLTSLRPKGILSRITFRAGEVSEIRSKFEWDLGDKVRVLSHEVTWVIHNVPDQLTWVRLNATQPPPILSLRELAPEANDVFRISIHHETERTLPPGNGETLKPQEVRQHFAAFYPALGVHPPDENNPSEKRLLPFLRDEGAGTVLCKTALGRLTV